ncbi:MAG: flavin reductase family protein [Chloroflexi bacterium]|jgi:flavin reductase (DIM6/NTAB) family NADH-FMN oxidoreductase RutF|nr:flavin reductase family protein [Chloroflexota bacterium]MBT4074321.1 flavin reductase family protein [Chloroflexota bacterium]MBT4514313.1 flavin reductase family protein [Chloroflexota bacterium]MBT5318410.1 flavin reductase family protein [Chloroflexota bacterium]MBT6682911.1 flavin reductase family protein [Chloroflexota bacterium]
MTLASDNPIPQREYRDAWGRFATGVTIITSMQSDGEIHGMTANGVTSVSLDPPMALVCVDKSRNTHGHISEDGWFGISIIRHDQADIAMYYVRDAADRTGDVEVQLENRQSGPPVIAGALAAMSCKVIAAHDAGDHTIFVGEAVELTQNDGDPLLYYTGKFGKLELD